MTVQYIVLLVGSYLLGSVPIAYLIARWIRGIDLRKYGSGNIGLSNIWQSTSKVFALPVILFDTGKGMLVVWLTQYLGFSIAHQVGAGLLAIIGHNWPVFLRFNGGRGNLTALGVIIILPVMNGMVPWSAIAALVLAGMGKFGIRDTAVGVGCAILALPLVSWIAGEPLSIVLGFLVIAVLLVSRRLTAPKTSLTGSVSSGQLFINRIVFDRDIRDRKTWINRKPLDPVLEGKSGK